MPNDATLQFISRHRADDVRRLAFAGHDNADIDLPYALDQIQGWQTARSKLPSWAAVEGIVYPPHLNMEQCSSEVTATYKARVLAEKMAKGTDDTLFVDLTGGFGVDFSFLSRPFSHSVYVERNEHLCALVTQNMSLLGLADAKVVCGDGTEYLHTLPLRGKSQHRTVVYLDPARRDDRGRKVFQLTDCEPDILQFRDALMARADVLMVKLSPMLDWHAAVRSLSPDGIGIDVHIVSTGGECKELLLVLTHEPTPLRMVCVNDDDMFVCQPSLSGQSDVPPRTSVTADGLHGVLLVPNASIMKAGCFDHLSARYGLRCLDTNSHLFVSPMPVPRFPGRQFRITGVSTMNKRELRQQLQGLTQANISVRNFPLSADQLRSRLKLRDGGNVYIFATTCGGRHILLFGEKLSVPSP